MAEIPIGIVTVLAQVGADVVWVLLPLVPSVLIYWLFPNTPVAVSGPLAGVSIKTGGAFGAYLVVLLLTWAELQTINQTITSWQSQFWTVKGTVQLVGPGEQPVRSSELIRGSDVVTTSLPHIFNEYEVTLRILQEKDGRLPLTMIKVPRFGEQKIEWSLGKKDYFSRTIEFSEPFKIRQETSTSNPIAATPSRLDSTPVDSSTSPASW
jgi:hypothetical protein